MTEELSRPQAATAVNDEGWRYVFGLARTFVPVASLAQALTVAEQSLAAAGPEADKHLRMDIRPDVVVLTVQTLETVSVTASDIAIVRRITAALRDIGQHPDPGVADGEGEEVATRTGLERSAQVIEIAIDALDIPAIRPFWKAVLGYQDETADAGTDGPLADPVGQGPTIWFQQMDAPRPQRNRMHFDVAVPHDEAARRIEAALAAGGTLRYDAEAPAFWLLADAEGNEACVCTWQGRDG